MYFTGTIKSCSMSRFAKIIIHLRLVCCVAAFLNFISGCAYFNTFYNARAYFNSSYQEHKKIMRDYPDSTLELDAEIAEGYDSAISKSLKVLDVYHKQEKWHDDAVFLIGKAHFYKKEYARAIRRFRQVQKEFPESPHIPESYLYLGKAYMEEEKLDKAEKTFDLILGKYPQLNKKEEVSVLLAQVAIRREGKAMALEILEKIRKSIKNDVEKMKLFLQIAALYMDLGKYDKAIALLRTSPRKRGLNRLLYQIDFTLLTCYLRVDSLTDAMQLAEKMLKNKAYERYVPAILIRKGAVQAELGNYDNAIETYERITERFDTSKVVGKAWFELGVIYQKQKGDYEKAKECYTKAASLVKDPDIQETAETRKEALILLARYRGEPDSTDTVEIQDSVSGWGLEQFRMGELFWLSLDEPDSALKYYTSLASDTSVREDSVPKAIYAAGWITRNAKNDTATSDSLFNLLISKYPTNIYAKEAQREKGEKVTIQTREDTAEYAFYQAEQKLFEHEYIEEAIEKYLEIYASYSDVKYGRRALYAAAWLYDNVLEKNVTARKLYIRLCDSFPESELCKNDVKPRLKVVEDTLRVLRARKKRKEKKNGQSLRKDRKIKAPEKNEKSGPPGNQGVSPPRPDSILEAGNKNSSEKEE
ncbi:MAG: tetratricopeptide repeat protein [Chitinivibrionales bacterium]|nr:tetratricopeptide repeat protein [Chitinivibrionales bacterium]